MTSQDDDYRVPKHRVAAEVLLPGQPPRDVELYLAERAKHHTGPERPSDLLNGDKRFLPAHVPGGRPVLLRRLSVVCLSVRAEDDVGPEPADADDLAQVDPSVEAERRGVRFLMEDGSEVEGTVTYVMPAGERRVQDFLNQAADFVRVRDGDLIRLVNVHLVAQVEALDGS